MEKIDVALQADEPLRAGLLRVVDNLVKNAVERIRNPSDDRVEDLHFVRVTIKRLPSRQGTRGEPREWRPMDIPKRLIECFDQE
jgi:hypothetical protein